MSIEKMYQDKLVTAEAAAAVIQSGDWVDYGWCTSTPVAVDCALAARLHELDDLKIRGGLLLWQPEIFKVTDFADRLCWNSWHTGGLERKLCATGGGFYTPLRYSELPRWYRDYFAVDVAVFQVCPMDEQGYFNFGPNNSHLKAVCETTKIVIVEVNHNIPRCEALCEGGIHISDVSMVVEGSNPPIAQMPASMSGEVDKMVAEQIVREIPNGACLQLGIGGMPGAVGDMIAKSDLKDLGIHTEMYVDSFVDMARAGKINGSRKSIDTGKEVYTFAAGTQKLYDYIQENPNVCSAPVNYTNDVRVIAEIDNFISINNAVDLDLFGQVNAESSGTKHISGAGGQLDFVLGAYLSNGGKSFICCSSTYQTRDGELKSRIRPTLTEGSIVTDTRANLHYIATEYGMVNVKGLSTWQRAEAIIGLAHPQFREQLIQDAERMNIWRRTNRKI